MSMPTEGPQRVNNTAQASTTNRVLGSLAFLVAGLFFPFVCFFSGLTYLTADGVDVHNSAAYATYAATSSAAVFLGSLLVAVVGLVLWIVQLARRRNVLLPGLLVLAAQLVALALLIFILPQGAPPMYGAL